MQNKLTLSISSIICLIIILLLNDNAIAASPEMHSIGSVTSNAPFVANTWLIIGVCLVILLMGYLGLRIYKTETPGIVFTEGVSFTPIGGWLILVMIGLVGAAVTAVFEPLRSNYFAISKWNAFITGSHSVEFRLLLIFKTMGYAFIGCYAVFCFILMLKRRDILPKYIIGFYISIPVFFIVRYILASGFNFESDSLLLPLTRSIIISGIWISYFKRSVRVEQTFIIPYPAHNYTYEEHEGQTNK